MVSKQAYKITKTSESYDQEKVWYQKIIDIFKIKKRQKNEIGTWNRTWKKWIITHMRVYKDDIVFLPRCQKDKLEILNLSSEMR